MGKRGPERKDPVERFATKFLVGDGCWDWFGAINSGGYGNFWTGRAYVNAHAFAYATFVGPTNGLDVDHLCRNRRCVNIGHLELVTRRENIRRGDVMGHTWTTWKKNRT